MTPQPAKPAAAVKPPAGDAAPDAATSIHDPEGEFAGEDVPVESWMTVPMSDSADWMNRTAPTYDEGEGEFAADAETTAPEAGGEEGAA